MDTRIYVCTHKPYIAPESSLYRTLHVGHIISPDLGYPGDDTGNHISEKNKTFCELTGVYWIWKNIQCDIIGICHYRRYFVKNEDFLTQQEIENLLTTDYDAILPTSGFTKYQSVGEHYAHEHFANDLSIVRDIIHELSPEYLPSFDLVMNCNLLSAWNMFITKKPIFDEYCAWLFPILFEAERRIDLSSYDAFQARIFGYLGERLLRVWFLHQHLRVREEKVRMMNPEDAYNQEKEIQAIDRLLRLKIGDLITIYRAGNYVNLTEFPAISKDFHGKIPVWVFWWQGFENAPDVVKLCQKSWHRHLPSSLVEIHEITEKNISDYVRFPDWMLKRFHDGEVSLTMFSDMLRMELLYHYGGLWMDATYYLASSLPDELFLRETDFYTIRLNKKKWKTDIAEGRWSGNFLRLPAGNLLPQFTRNAFYYYFLENEKPIHYFMIDFFIKIAYEEFAEVRQMIEACPVSQPEVFTLEELLNETYEPDVWKNMVKSTVIYKLSYKFSLRKTDVLGRDTYYGYLLKNNP